MTTTLNREQLLASRPDGGINLVIAGAGTGKTSALIKKTENLIVSGIVRADQLLILTFSRKAAEELRERIESVLDGRGKGITAGTFHSFCYGLIQEYYREIGFTDMPGIVDDDEMNLFLHDRIRGKLEDFKGLPMKIIVRMLNNPPEPGSPVLTNLERAGISTALEGLRRDIANYKKEGNLLDYEDLIDRSIETLENNHNIRAIIRERYRYLLVDEFQDTSENNFRLLKQLIDPAHPNLFAVGDDWQSIYGFRNARLEYIVNMKAFFPMVRTVKLRINYRSKREIVKLSNRFIARNRYRTSKKLVSYSGKGGIVSAYTVKSMEEECRCIERIIAGCEGEICLLYRNNWQGERISKQLNQMEQLREHPPLMMTIHASKGLEFDCVIIAGISDKIIPDPASDIEEERRLLYVALTRARKTLCLMYHENENGNMPRFAGELGIAAVRFSASTVPG